MSDAAAQALPGVAAPATRRSAAVVGLLLLAWLSALAGARPLMLPDEGRYVGVAWEMLQSGRWLTPTLDGLPFFHKPPLFYWITAAALALFGPNEWAARVAPLAGAWVAGWALYLFVRRWADESRARLTLLLLAVQPLFYVGGQFANLDMLVAGCITVTVLLAAHAVLCIEAQRPHAGALAGAWAAAGLGVLAKGLIGLVIPGAVLLAWLLAWGRWRRLPRLLAGPGPLLFAAITLPWFVVMQLRHPGFFDYFFVVQHVRRFAAGGVFNNVQPWWFYPAVLALLSLPMLPWLASLPRTPRRDPLRPLMLAWAVVVVVFFSLPASKLVGYVLPAVPPLAALMAEGLAAAMQAASGRRRWGRASLILCATAAIGFVAVLVTHTPHSGRALGRELAGGAAGGGPVVVLRSYPYDLPWYARLSAPMVVVDDWAAAAAAGRDDWRKELLDAARFAPGQARSTLVDAPAVAGLLCAQRLSWLVGSPADAARWAGTNPPVFVDGDRGLWKIDSSLSATADRLGCPQRKPSSGSPGR